jgi:transcriptional regulatory protein LEU3
VSSGSLTQNCASLSILAFYFFVKPEKLRSPGLLSLFSHATNILDLAARIDAAHDFSKSSTSYYLRIISLAAFCIVRILRSSFKQHINIRDAEQSLFKAINFLKKRSIEHGDLDERYGIILSQLWSNSGISTKTEEMVDGFHFEIRSRSVG